MRQPKNSSDGPTGTPWSRSAARSCRKPRNGASPVPAPIMIIGVCGFSGGRNAMLGERTKVNTVPFSGSPARYPEPIPVNVPAPERAGPRSTPTVMLQASGLTRGEEEME